MRNNVLYYTNKTEIFKKIYLQRWRERWFTLRHSGELPGQYFLEYYTDKKCRKLKGKIDLDQCEQVMLSFYKSLNNVAMKNVKLILI